MKRTALLASVLVLSIVACKKKEGDQAKPAEPSKPAEPAKPAAPPPPFTGTLTGERILGAKDLVKPMTPWAEGLATLKGQLGEPTRVKDGKHEWAVVEGDDCTYMFVEKEDGAKFQMSGEIVGMVMSPMKVAKDGPMMNRKDCLAITGVTAGPPEDPNAAGPPADGTAVTVDAFRTDAIAGRSKWKGQKVAVSGIFAGSTTSTSGADSWTTISVKAKADDAGKPLSCSLPKNTPAPTVDANAAVTATGTVKINEWTSMGDGATTLEAALDECTLEVAKTAGKKSK